MQTSLELFEPPPFFNPFVVLRLSPPLATVFRVAVGGEIFSLPS